MSVALNFILQQMKSQSQTMGSDLDVEALRENAKRSSQIQAEPDVAFETVFLGSRETDLALPQQQRQNAVILYIHGGGMVSGDPTYMRAYTSFLAKQSGMKVYGITYRLAPEDKFPAAPLDSLEAYLALREREPGKKIILLGESAGAYLAIATTLMARDKQLSLPDAVVAYAPCGDLTGRLDRSPYKDTDPVIGFGLEPRLRELYCPQTPENPYASICLADYHDFPPLRIVWDADEALSPDCREIAEKAVQAGSYVEAKEWKGTFHTFEVIGKMLPEAVEEMNDTLQFVKKQLGWQ